MGDQPTVSYKVYLYKQEYATPKGPALEVRRIGIDRDVSTSYTYLKEKLVNVFPILGRTKNQYSVIWQDEENEWITIRTDEELVIALTEMAGPVYKLHVQFAADENDVKSTSIFGLIGEVDGKEHGGNDGGEIHPGVTCDGCEKAIAGFRYKCVQCPDYDLCGGCENKGIHPGHNMMRIASPEGVWPQHFFRRLNKMHDRINRRASSASCASDLKEEECEENKEELPRVPPFGCGRGRAGRRQGPFGRGAFGSGPRCGFGGGNPFPPGSGNQWFEAMMKGWAGEGQQPGFGAAAENIAKAAHDSAHQAAHAAAASHAAAAAHQAAHAAAAAAAASQATAANPAENLSTTENIDPQERSNQETGHKGPTRSESFERIFKGNNEFLANVGHMVAAALDPFGIDVEVDVETANGQRTSCSSKTTSENTTTQNEEKNDLNVQSPTEEANEEPSKKDGISTTEAEKSDTEEDEFEFLSKSPEPKTEASIETKEINIPIQVETKSGKEKEESTMENQKGEPSKNQPEGAAKQSDLPIVKDVPINVTNQPANVLYGAPNGGPLYPELPKKETSSANSKVGNAPEASAPVVDESSEKTFNVGVAKHKDPRIQVALQAMLNMGFTNEGGWLTQLLEAKEGDIGKTLDVLQPVNPATRK